MEKDIKLILLVLQILSFFRAHRNQQGIPGKEHKVKGKGILREMKAES